MKTRKNNKRALIVSMLSLLLCVSMLVGTTFAWFTDNATTAVSNIVSGTLDIELLDGNTENASSLEGKTLTFKKAAGHESETVLFEPGAKYSLTQVWLHNAGNLNAKYQVVITGIDGSSKLAEVLDVYVAGAKAGTLADLVAKGGIINSSVIAPNAYYSFGTIELEMQTTAGNEYQGLTMDGIAITVQATQATAEYDSNNNQYDAGAQYDKLVFATTQTELNDAISNAPADKPVTISLSANTTFTLSQKIGDKDITFTGSKDTKIDMTNYQYGYQLTNGTALTFSGVTVDFADNNTYAGFTHAEKVVFENCVIEGQMALYSEAVFINCTFKNNSDYCVRTYGSTNATFEGCTFETGGKALLLYKDQTVTATVTVNNCVFKDDGTLNTQKAAVEVCQDGSTKTSNWTVYLNNCTVNGFSVTEQNATTCGGSNLGTALWGNKNLMTAEALKIVVDGTEVY